MDRLQAVLSRMRFGYTFRSVFCREWIGSRGSISQNEATYSAPSSLDSGTGTPHFSPEQHLCIGDEITSPSALKRHDIYEVQPSELGINKSEVYDPKYLN